LRKLAATVAVGIVGALVAIVAWAVIIYERAVPVRFVNDTPIVVTLPDCSTDIATIKAGQTAVLPVASDVGNECTVDDALGGVVIDCITMPNVVVANMVIRVAPNHPCREPSG
jgi:hypothetical protein